MAFPFVAVALMVTQIEYHLSVMVGAVLIPFGIFGPDRLSHRVLYRLDHRAVSCACSSRPSWSGIGFPLFSTAVVALTAGGNPTSYSAMIVALVSLLYAGPALVGAEQGRTDVWPGGPGAQWRHGRGGAMGVGRVAAGGGAGRPWRVPDDAEGERT